MNSTSLGLLDRLKDARPDSAEWRRVHDIYLPLIRSWVSRVPGVGDEARDLSQEVLLVVFRELPSFDRRADGAFRAWLRQITVNRLRAFWKARQRRPLAGGQEADRLLSQLEDSNGDLAREWDRDHDRHVFEKLLAIVQPDFEPHTWQAFTRFALDGLSAAVVGDELGMSDNAVLQAKFRVLKRLREEAGELLD
jgi:RNA polymerase sigma-70 factor, ECF subfamily